jgi:hypothetical protein
MGNENKIKHLEFIQLTITRMNVNSFLIKGWVVTIVAAIFVLSQKDAKVQFLWFAPFSSLLFWIMDSYFLLTERKYRSLYDHIRKLQESEIDYSMDTNCFKGGKNTFLNGFFSLSLILFYPVIIIASSIAMWLWR